MDPRTRGKSHSDSNGKNWLPYVYALVTGVVAFFMTVGYRALIPTNIAWLGQGDPATGYLGWAVFRDSPWLMPPGANGDYGLEIGSGIIYSDSNPILAFIFKSFSFLLPEIFQYFGVWILLCLCLQAFFAFKLLGLFSEDATIICLASTFFVVSPPMLFRLFGHYNLVAHFLILCALYLVLKPHNTQHATKWSITVGVAALIHPYLLAMVGIIYIGDALSRLIKKGISKVRLLRMSVAVLATTLVSCWLAGYFTAADSYSLGGFGLYRMNLLSLIDPLGWSYVLPNLPRGPGDYEGFNYIGLGMLLLIVPVLFIFARNPRALTKIASEHIVFGLLLVALTLFALSNRIGLGSAQIEIAIPKVVGSLAEILRSSGRLFWPVFYVIYLVILFVLIRNVRRPVLIIILAAALIIQFADTSNGWSKNRSLLMAAPSSTWPTPLIDPFWNEAAEKYDKVRWLLTPFPPQQDLDRWKTVADYAIRSKLPTDAAYLARIDSQGIEQATVKRRDALSFGVFEADSLYFLDASQLLQVALNIDPNRDLLALIDGFGVLAPGWKSCPECRTVETEVGLQSLLSDPLGPPSTIEFSASGTGSKYLVSGWSAPENEGVWSAENVVRIAIPLTDETTSAIVLRILPFLSESHPQQRISIELNSMPVGTRELDFNSSDDLTITVPPTLRRSIRSSGVLDIVLRLPDAVQPSSLGISSDTRQLGIFLYSLTVL